MVTTPAQLGMQTPTGTDLISGGDNAITKNAQVTAEWVGRLLNGEIKPIELTGGEDLNTFRTSNYYILRAASIAAPILNGPPGMQHNVFLLRVVAYTLGSFQYVMQEWAGLSGEAAGYFKRNTSGASGALFIPWRRLDNEVAVSTGGDGNANALRVQEFKDYYGPIDTGGAAAVALRFDHGLANFNTKARPLLESRGFAYCLALSSRGWNEAENSGVTPAMVNSWLLAEVWAHGAGPNHNDASDLAGLTDQIVGGKAELQAQLPAKKIWGFIPPGVGGTNYGGFNGGSTVEELYGTLAGQLILENHAVTSGALPGTAFRPLDGEVRQGMAHAGLESRTVASTKALIDTAISQKTGLQLMTHPSRLDVAGYMTTAEFAEVLDYIVEKSAMGDLVVLSPYEMMVADARPGIKVYETSGRLVTVWDYVNGREQMVYGDTGNRNLTNVGITAGSVYLRRIGNTVTLVAQSAVFGTMAGGVTLVSLPAGFRPGRIIQARTAKYWSSDADIGVRANPNNSAFETSGLVAGSVLNWAVSWDTSDPWPTTLPGVAAGSIPA